MGMLESGHKTPVSMRQSKNFGISVVSPAQLHQTRGGFGAPVFMELIHFHKLHKQLVNLDTG